MPAFLLDTNVVSELVRPAPAPRVLAWIEGQAPGDLFLSAVTLGELVRGAARLSAGRRCRELLRWIEEDLRTQFSGRILPFDREAAVIWGNLMGEADRAGRPFAAADAQIAATSIQHKLVIATRNTSDFRIAAVAVLNPWVAGS